MEIHTNIPLKNYLTMRLGGNARFMTDVIRAEDLPAVCQNAQTQGIPIFMLGGGSNVIARDEGYNGLVIRNRIPGFTIVSDDAMNTLVRVGSGENWDEIVRKTVEMDLTGIEALSGIPGTAGAAPIQNIGAYGQEVSETLQSLEAYDIADNRFIILQNEDCNFSYRDSIFKSSAKGRYVITAITLKLYKSTPKPPFYDSVQTALDEKGITLYTPQIIRDTVLEIRKNKLPDPSEYPNAGSFFKNAIVEDWQLDTLKSGHPDMPIYELTDNKYKVSTGWLIENAGFKGKLLNGIRIHDKNALVLINESAKSYNDLDAARKEIMGVIRDTFRITIEQEPIEMN